MSSLVGMMNLSVQPPSGECILYCNGQPFSYQDVAHVLFLPVRSIKSMSRKCNNAMNNGGHSNCDDTTFPVRSIKSMSCVIKKKKTMSCNSDDDAGKYELTVCKMQNALT
jgi:hypothetical protein